MPIPNVPYFVEKYISMTQEAIDMNRKLILATKPTKNMKPISSKSLRAERREKSIERFLQNTLDIIKIAIGVVVGVGILWIIQVGVTSI